VNLQKKIAIACSLKSKLESINYCIYWTTSVILTKFAEYIVYKNAVFGSISYCCCWHTKVFLGNCFYRRTLLSYSTTIVKCCGQSGHCLYLS